MPTRSGSGKVAVSSQEAWDMWVDEATSKALDAWVLTRYEDVRRVCLDKQLLSSNRLKPFFAALAPPEAERIAHIMRYLSLWMVFTDPPDHTRLRNLTSKVFSAKAMQGIRPDRKSTRLNSSHSSVSRMPSSA